MNSKNILLMFLLSILCTASFAQDGTDYDTFFKGAEKFEKFAADVLEDRLLDEQSLGESVPNRVSGFLQGELLSTGGNLSIGSDISEEMGRIILASENKFKGYPKKTVCERAVKNPAGWVFSHVKNLRLFRGMANIAYNLVTKDIPGAPALAARLVEAPTRAAYEQIRKKLESEVQNWWKSGRPGESFKWNGTWDFLEAECDISYSVLWNKEKESYLYQLSGDCNCEPVRIPLSNQSATLESFQILGGGDATIEIETAGFDSDTRSDPQAVLRISSQHFKMQTDCDCNNEDNDNIDSANATFQPDAGEPSEKVTITLTAQDPAGRNIDIHAVDIAGLDAIMEEGADYNMVTALPAKNVDVEFTIADPKKDDTYGLDIELTDFEGVTTTINPVYEVLNVAPELVSLENNSASADPGETMALDGVEVTLIDRNADENNESEVTTNQISMLEKPLNLNTVPDFDMFDHKSKTSFDPKTGTYVFELSRGALVNNPHEHGRFQNEFTISDDDKEEVGDTLSYVVNNVPPVIERTSVEPRRFLHSKNQIGIIVHLTIRDNNGYNDINRVTVDASEAAASENVAFERNNGLRKDDFDNKRISFSTAKFVHTRDPNQHSILIIATDKPDVDGNFNTVKGSDFINVGNEKPELGATGYIWGGTEEEELTITPANRRVCPGEEITVGVQAVDPEGDPLRVTATLNGNEIELEAQQGGTYTGEFTAPAPGVYTIQFEAQEMVFDEQFTDPSSLQLKVEPCEEDEEEEQTEDQRVSSREPVKEIPEEPNPQPTGNTDWDFDFETYRVGLDLGYETRYNLEDEACNQQELDHCEATNGSPAIGLFVETDAIDNIKLPGLNTDLSLSVGFRFNRSSTDFRQMYNQGSGYPYRVDGSVSFTSAGLYSKFSAPVKEGYPMDDSVFETNFNIGFNYTWNKGEFDNQLFPSGSETQTQSRSHQNLNYSMGAGVNVNWNQNIGTGLGVYWGTDGGAADALFGVRANVIYNF
ncbi:MAG: hypothetical protein GVY07_01650 [Bacteroidetes bacterium]|jgi:hypothetical protein|nr:hypothetical protein [Bacteroidota bacterium]